jgi:hypothetical protein
MPRRKTAPPPALPAPTPGAPALDFWRQEAAGFEARLCDVLAALDEAGVDPHDKLEEGDSVRALAAERDQLRDLVGTIREELGLLEVHDDAELLRELAELKAIRVVLAGVKAFEVDYHDVVARAEAAEDALAAGRGGYVGGALS